MAHIASGGPADSSQYNAHDDRIQNLENNVVTSGGTVGSASLSNNFGFDETTGTTSANGRITVTHGLGFTPTAVFIQLRGSGGPYGSYVISPTSSQFTVQFYSLVDGGAAHVSQSVTFDWLAFK